MRTNIILLSLTLALASAVASCDRTHSDSPTPTQPSGIDSTTPALTAPPFTLSKPLDARAALSEPSFNLTSWYVLDLASGLVQVIAPDSSPQRIEAQGNSVGLSPSWIDNDTLLVRNVDGKAFLADLSGVIRASASPVGTPTAPSPTGGGVSRDGRWQASLTAVDGPGVVIGSTDGAGVRGKPLFKVTVAALPLWSPTAPATLALLVNVCNGRSPAVGFDLSLFDPVSGQLRPLSALTDQFIPSFVWTPDGSSIAADVVNFTDSTRQIQLIDATTGIAQTLVSIAIAQGGELVPLEWNRDGSKLLFNYHGGHDICGVNEMPGPLSELQRIAG